MANEYEGVRFIMSTPTTVKRTLPQLGEPPPRHFAPFPNMVGTRGVDGH